MRFTSMRCFVLQQPLLTWQSSTIASQRAVSSDHAMTRHDDADGVAPICQADRTHCVRIADPQRDVFIRSSLTIRNLQQGLPNTLLKYCSYGLELQIEGLNLAGEVRTQLC